MINQKSIKIIIVLGIVTLIVFVLSLLLRQAPQPKLIQSDPQNNARNVGLFQTIKLKFDLDVNGSAVNIISNPEESWIITNLDSNTLALSHKLALNPSSDYQLSVNLDNKNIANFSFTTQVSQSDPRLVQTIVEEMDRDYPLASKTPIDTPGYHIVYSSPMTLEISLKNQNISQEEALTYAQNFVKEQGLEPSSHQYVLNDALLSPSPSPSARPTLSPTTPPPAPTEIDWDNLQDDGT